MDVWIALVEVTVEQPGTDLEGRAGAFTNALATATSCSHFKERVHAALLEEGLGAKAFEDFELFKERASKMLLGPDLHTLAEEAEDTGTVMFTTFHTFETDTDIN